MNRKNTCVIFDLDGTLLYTIEDLCSSTNYALSALNYPQRTLEEVRSFVGNGVRKLIERALGDNYLKIDECLRVFKEHYSNNSQNKTRPYDGIEEVLSELKKEGIKIAVNSNKYDKAVKKLCEKYFPNTIDFALGECDNCPKKPSAKGVKIILKTLKCKNAIYVGDSIVDIETAKNAAIPCLSVEWGYADNNILKDANPDMCIKNPQELILKIRSLLG